MANIKKLKHLRRMIKNIPKKNINWGNYITKWDSDWNKCVLCPGGWVATDPFLNEGLVWIEEGPTHVGGPGFVFRHEFGNMRNTLRQIFELTEDEYHNLFLNDLSENPVKEHKSLFLEELDAIIGYHS